jgi:hypothetical protein
LRSWPATSGGSAGPGRRDTHGSLERRHFASRRGPARASSRAARRARKGRADHASHHVSRHASDPRGAGRAGWVARDRPVGDPPERRAGSHACLIGVSRPWSPCCSA